MARRRGKIKAFDPDAKLNKAQLEQRAKIEAQYDRAPTKKTTARSDKAPRSFRHMLQGIRKTEKIAKEPKKPKQADSNSIAPVARPDESLNEYSRRVDAAFREQLQTDMRNTRKVSARRKEHLLQRKKHLAEKGAAAKDELLEESVRQRTEQTAPKFGEVAQDIPHIKTVLKQRKRPQHEISNKDGSDEEEEESAPRPPKPVDEPGEPLPKRTKLRDLSAADKRQLETERERVIAQYRQLRAVQMLRGEKVDA